MDYIAVEKSLIPYRFDIAIEGKTYTFEVHYNAENDYFTVDLYRNGDLVSRSKNSIRQTAICRS